MSDLLCGLVQALPIPEDILTQQKRCAQWFPLSAICAVSNSPQSTGDLHGGHQSVDEIHELVTGDSIVQAVVVVGGRHDRKIHLSHHNFKVICGKIAFYSRPYWSKHWRSCYGENMEH